MDQLYDVSICIPSFNGAQALQQTLDTLCTQVAEAEIIVADGGSTDGSIELIRHYPNVRLLEIANHGYGHALNRASEIAKHNILIWMNSDVLLTRVAILAMKKQLLAVPNVAAVAPVPLQANGKKQQSFGPLAWYLPNYITITKPTRVNMLHGYLIATRRDVLQKIGGFDENFFFYNEEYDWCWRALKAGYQLEILPETAIHFGGSSTTDSPEILLEGRRGGMYVVDKHFPYWIAQATRRFFQLEAWLMQTFEKRTEYQMVWHKLESYMLRASYLETPFPLSGRGEVKFK